MKLFETVEAMEAIPKIRRPKAKHATDQIVAQARQLGRTVGITMAHGPVEVSPNRDPQIDEAGLAEIVATTDMALQIVQAGNRRSALYILDLARQHDTLARVCLASDTPTGTA